MVDESVLELVRKLMARAESTTSENEARMCRERADRLIFKHAIDTAQLAGGGETVSAKMGMVCVASSGVYRTVLHRGKMNVAAAYGTAFFLYRIGRRQSLLELYGEQADVDVLELVLASLEAQAMAGVRQWWKQYKVEHGAHYWPASACLRARRSWVNSFFMGVVTQVLASRHEVVESAGKGELVVMKRDRGREFAQGSGVEWRQGRPFRTSAYHVDDGYRAGLEASLIAGGVAEGEQVRQVEA